MMETTETVIFAYLALMFARWYLAIRYAATLPNPTSTPLPSGFLTVIQPILSGDPMLEKCLRENLDSLHGQQFLWMIDDSDDEAICLANKLHRPGVATILCPPCPDGANPKVWKLRLAESVLSTPFLAVVDDDTVLSETSAAFLIQAAESATVATGLPCYRNAGNIASRLLAQFVNNQSAFTYLGTSSLFPPLTLNGMGYCMKRCELERLGGFGPILKEITDDLAMATLVLRAGGTIHQSGAPLKVNTSVKNCHHYSSLMHRWHVFALLLLSRTTWRVRWIIMILNGLPPFLFTASVLLGLWFSPMLLLVVLAIRLLTIRNTQRRSFGEAIHLPMLSILSELLQPLHVFHALFSKDIHWRGRRYRIRNTEEFFSK